MKSNKDLNTNNRVNYRLKPSNKLIKNWQYVIARETISQLRQRVTNIDTQQLEAFINLEQFQPGNKIWSNFESLIFQEVKANFCINQNTSWLKPKLEQEYLDKVSDRITEIAHIKEIERCNKLNNYLKEEFRVASPNTVMNVLKNASKHLLMQRRNISNRELQISVEIESATRAYRNLISKKNPNFHVIISNALKLIFQLKYQRKWDEIQSHLATKLLSIVQNYYNDAKASYMFLQEVENSLSKKCSVDLLNSPVFLYIKPVDLNCQQFLLDLWMECSINSWSNNSVNIEEFEEEVLNNTREIVKERLEGLLAQTTFVSSAF